jgi:AraC-like DNA-binding protein
MSPTSVRERIEIVVLPAIPNAELLTGSLIARGVLPSALRCWRVILVESGVLTLYDGREARQAREGDLVVGAPGCVMGLRAGTGDGALIRLLDVAGFRHALAGPELRAHAGLGVVTSDAQSVPAVRLMLDELQGKHGPAPAAAVVEQRIAEIWSLPVILASVGDLQLRRGLEPATITATRIFLEENSRRVLSLAELSEVAGLSRFHLIRVFTQFTGLTPYAYFLQHRVALARGLLQSGANVLEAANAFGFADRSHFARHFTRHVGVSPGRYARAVAMSRGDSILHGPSLGDGGRGGHAARIGFVA